MSWYHHQYPGMPSIPSNQPNQSGVYASDLENQYFLEAYQSTYYNAPPPAFNHTMFSPIDAAEMNGAHSLQHDMAHLLVGQSGAQYVPDVTNSAYVPGMPVQQNYGFAANNRMMQPAAPAQLNQDLSYSPRYNDDQRAPNNNSNRGRGNRGRNNFHNFGRYQQSSQNSKPAEGLEFHRSQSAVQGSYRGQQSNRRNFRGQGNQRFMQTGQQRRHDDYNKSQNQEMEDSNNQYSSKEPKYNESKNTKNTYFDSVNGMLYENRNNLTSQNSVREKKDRNNFSRERMNQASATNFGRNKECHEEMTSSRPQNNDRKREKKPLSKSGNNVTKGARSKYGTTWDYQSADKDESQRGSLTEQLSRNVYECMVCCDIIKADSAVWSCENCYHVFHLHCTKKWAQSSLDKDSKLWRCPGCQNESSQIPSQYRCFCGRRRDPAYVRGETPHSCGEPCRKKKKHNCSHPCTILCHPGPCPPCSSMVTQFCDCGKEKKSVRCSVATPFKCNRVCDEDLLCGQHKCADTCHSGDCKLCTFSKVQGCFCGKRERQVTCGRPEFTMISYSCEESCGRTLSCGNHTCEVACHPGECAPCSADPAVLTTCCCGETSLELLNAPERHSCLDPIPVCGQICNKPMACGPSANHHLCEKHCHQGDCGPCDKETSVNCQCGRISKDFSCETAVAFNEFNPFKCQRRCGKKKTCGRHKCSDNCCVKDFHICDYVCGLKLSCGLHKCKELCHRGNCKRCLETSFEDLSCFCGATVMEPPIPCGTRPPECHQLCTRPQDCGHPVRHNCHMEDDCAPCTELVEKICMGGHTARKNIPCHMKNISCGMPCNKKLPCSMHRCMKTCHKGPCLLKGESCTQVCPKPRQACGHPCGAVCHSGDCPSTFCKTEILITCRCGNRSAKMECKMGGDQSNEIAQFQRLSVQSIAESGADGVDMSQFCQTKSGSRKLDCDTTCAVLERNKRMALALELSNPDMNAKLGNPTFTDFLKDFGKKNSKFAYSVEKVLGELVQTAKKSPQNNRSHSFPVMNRDQRRFVHELAEFYGCQTQSYDFEPNKNVVATACKDKCWLPNVVLTQLLFKDQTAKAPPPLSGMKTQGVTFTVLEKKKPAPTVKDSAPASFRAWETVPSAKPPTKMSGTESTKPGEAPSIDYFDFTGS